MSGLVTPGTVGALLVPIWIPRNWGGELLFVNDEERGYCGKKLLILAGKQTSWHYHKVKDEVLLVESGRVILVYAPQNKKKEWEDNIEMARQIDLTPGQAFHVPATMRHRLIGIETCWLVEVGTIERLEDTVHLLRGD